MAVRDIALAARARGVATHLLARQALESLADAGDVASFAQALTRFGTAVHPVAEPRDVFAAERAIRLTAIRHLQTLRRWQAAVPGALDVFFAFEDRRSLRALIRGAADGQPADVRLAGLLPTPTLPAVMLSQLARKPSPAGVVAHLADAGHPDAPPLSAVVRTARPDLLAVDVALLRTCAGRVMAIADRGDDVLRAFVSSAVDVSNAQSALLLATDHRDVNVAPLFVSGGRWVSSSAFASAAAAASQEAARGVLAAAVSGSPLRRWLPLAGGNLDHLDRAFITDTLAHLTRAARLDPLGSAPVLRTALLIAAQTRDLRALAWGAVFATPAWMLKQQLVTPT